MSDAFVPVFKGMMMKFEEDGSNAQQFADFLGAKVDRSGETVAIAIDSEKYVTYIHPGSYGAMVDGEPRKLYEEDFLELFNAPA